jgi:hypothetical protein
MAFSMIDNDDNDDEDNDNENKNNINKAFASVDPSTAKSPSQHNIQCPLQMDLCRCRCRCHCCCRCFELDIERKLCVFSEFLKKIHRHHRRHCSRCQCHCRCRRNCSSPLLSAPLLSSKDIRDHPACRRGPSLRLWPGGASR